MAKYNVNQMYGQYPGVGYGYPQYGYPQAQFPYPAGGVLGSNVPTTAGGYGYPVPQTPVGTPGIQGPGMLPLEESYIENILRLNRGKVATVYMTFENNQEWNAKVFKGVIEAAGRDHIILSDPQTGRRYLLLMIYLDFITFDEELDYEYPYAEPGAEIPGYPG